MGFFKKIFGGDSSTDEEIKRACDSDVFTNIAEVIGDDKDKYKKVINYLSEQDNLSMKLRIMSLPVSEENDLMSALMNLEPSEADKLDRLCKDKLNPVLHFSMHEGMEIFIRVIANDGGNLDVVGLMGKTPLNIASEYGLTDMVKMLINNGAEAFDKCDDSGFAPLHYACQLGNPNMVEAFIRAGADVNVMTDNKLMPIHLAISTSQAASMSPTAPNGLPWSTRGALKCVELLANNGADLNYVCPYGFSAMTFLKRIGAVR